MNSFPRWKMIERDDANAASRAKRDDPEIAAAAD
jgi:hypothetical protein